MAVAIYRLVWFLLIIPVTINTKENDEELFKMNINKGLLRNRKIVKEIKHDLERLRIGNMVFLDGLNKDILSTIINSTRNSGGDQDDNHARNANLTHLKTGMILYINYHILFRVIWHIISTRKGTVARREIICHITLNKM